MKNKAIVKIIIQDGDYYRQYEDGTIELFVLTEEYEGNLEREGDEPKSLSD